MSKFDNQSGPWEGFYLDPGPSRHMMSMVLNFSRNSIDGSGSDDIGTFEWQGRYDSASGKCDLTKSYSTHQVRYQGYWDELGIWGTWRLRSRSGGFHIWPKNSNYEENIAVKRTENLITG